MLIQQTEELEETSTEGTLGTQATQVTQVAHANQHLGETALPQEESEELLQKLKRHGRRRRGLSATNLILKWIVGSNAAIGLGMYAFHLIRSGGHAHLALNWLDWSGTVSVHTDRVGDTVVSFGGAYIILSIVSILCLFGLRAYTKKQARLSKRLPHVVDPRATGFLVEALKLGDESLREEATSAVIPLLTRMSPADTGVLAAHHFEILHGEIEKGPDALCDAAIFALEQVGVEADAEVLEGIASGKLSLERRAAIENCAASIRRKVAVEQERIRYLRPAAASPAEEALLRPIQSSNESDPATLLRPSQ